MNAESTFWSFACTFYQNPDHQQQLLFMQNEGGIDVCFVLLALWHGGLRRVHWQQLMQQSAELRRELDWLRRLRQQNKSRWPNDEYYQALKHAELALEKNLYHELETMVNTLPALSLTDVKQSLRDLFDCYHLPAGFVAPNWP